LHFNPIILKRVLLFLIPFCLTFNACNWFKETPEVGLMLAEHFNNKLYKKFDTAEFNVIFKKHLDSLKGGFSNQNTIFTKQ
jgi:hypothetical protein